MASKMQLQQWQLYNPLDKSTSIPNVPRSNKLPYTKTDSNTTAMLLQPKVSTVGICPARSSMDVDNLKVMMIGSSVGDTTDFQEKIDKSETAEKHEDPPARGKEEKPKEREKMPAIINTEGTTTRPQFVMRAKPPAMPRSKFKVKRKKKVTVPPNSSSSRKSTTNATPSSNDKEQKKSVHSITVSSAHGSALTDPGTVMSVEITEPAPSPGRSIDDMIQTLRSSRQASGSHKSMSDQKIDEILQQVMTHAQEWISETHRKDDKESEEEEEASSIQSQKEDVAFLPPYRERKEEQEKNVEVDIDISDTVSTLASQLSAPAGIPDVSSILMRKSSHALRGGSSQLSATSSPIAMMQDDDDLWDYDQALRDLNLSLNVRNDDILSVQGGNPPILEKPVPGFKDEKDTRRVIDHIPSYTCGGKIHRLCLLPSINELMVTPKEFALSKVLHASSHIDQSSQDDAKANPSNPRKNLTKKANPLETLSSNTGNLPSDYLDSSKLDPLDIDGWRRLVEGAFHKDDYTVQGERSSTDDWGMWRMLWTVAPPKMALSTSAVKALVFPRYHGTQTSTTEEIEDESWQGDDELSEINIEDEDEHEFNERTLNRKHKSVEDLTTLGLKQRSKMPLRKLSSPNLVYRKSEEYSTNVLVKTDYSSGMSDVRQQKELAFQQHMKTKQEIIEQSKPQTSESLVEEQSKVTIERSQATVSVSDPAVSRVTINEQDGKKSNLSLQAKDSGRNYIVFNKKKLKSRRSKRFVQNTRKLVLSYKPLSLMRSQSCDSFLPITAHELKSLPNFQVKQKKNQLQGKLTRSTSLPRISEFDWFISRHQKYGEKIHELREWVRDIWNVWFDEVYPPGTDDESSFSDEEEDMEDSDEKKDEGKLKHDHKHVSIPDVIPPALACIPEDVEEPEEVMREAVNQLTEDLLELTKQETSKRACHLARRGALLRRLGEIKQASGDLDEAITLEPHLAQAYWQRHLIRLLKNQHHEALDDLNALLKLNKTNINGYRSRADVFALLGDYTMAVVNYSQAIKLNPHDEEPYFQRANIFEKTGDMLLAMEDYGSVVQLNPNRTDALLRRALFNFEKKSWHSAVTDFTQLIRKEPLNAQARTYRGRAYAEFGQHESALSDLSAAIHLDPLNACAYYHRGALLRTAAPSKALQDLSTSLLLDDSEKNVLALLHRGILYSELKRYHEAMADFEQTLRVDHSIVCAHVNIGLIHLLVTDNYWEAVRRFTFAIKGDPTYTRSYVCRSDALARTHDYKAALHDITRAIHLQPTERHLYLRRGKLLLQLRHLKLAAFCVRHIATLEKGFVSTSPTQQAVVQSFLGNHTAAVDSLSAACRTKPVPHMYVLLSKTLMKGKRFKEAITNLRNALELSTLYAYGDATRTDQQAPPETAEIHFLLGQCSTEMCDHSEALSAYNQALKVNSSYAEAYYQRGLCRLKLDHAKGVQDLNRALALQPTLFEAYLSRAAFYSTKKRYSKAILNCNEAVRLHPRSVRALLCRGALKFRISAFHHAINDLTMAIELDKRCSLAYYNRAVCLHRMKNHHRALKDYSIVLVLTDTDDNEATNALRVRVFVNRALLYLHYEIPDARNAALDLEQAALLSPNNTSILHTMALCYHKLQDLVEAESAYTRCLDVDPYFLTAYVGRGDAYGDAGNFEAAKVEYQRALKLDPSYVDARVHLGYNLQMSGHLQQAWFQFTIAIELDSSCQPALEGRAVTCLHGGDLFAASRDLAIALQRGKPSARLLTACGVVHQCQHDLHSAMTHYNKACALDATYTPAHFNAAVLYMRDRRFNEALQCLEIVIRQRPDDSAAVLNRAIARVFLNKAHDAMSDLDYALHLDPHNAHIYYNRANLHYIMKNYKEAERDYTTAFEINPSDYLTLKRRADVRGRLGQKKAAVEDYRQSLVIFERHTRLRNIRAG